MLHIVLTLLALFQCSYIGITKQPLYLGPGAPQVIIYFKNIPYVSEGWTVFGYYNGYHRPLCTVIYINPRLLNRPGAKCDLLETIFHELCHNALNDPNETEAEYCALVVLKRAGYVDCAYRKAMHYIFDWYLCQVFSDIDRCSKLIYEAYSALARLDLSRAEELYWEARYCLMDLSYDLDVRNVPYAVSALAFLSNGRGISSYVLWEIDREWRRILRYGLEVYRYVVSRVRR